MADGFLAFRTDASVLGEDVRTKRQTRIRGTGQKASDGEIVVRVFPSLMAIYIYVQGKEVLEDERVGIRAKMN